MSKSLLVLIIIYIDKNKNDYKGLCRLTAFIVLLTAILAGYLFIRHLVLYGDLLGFKTSHKFGALYGAPENSAINRPNPKNVGISIFEMLFEWQWLEVSYKSLIGCFGYMSFWLPDAIYNLFSAFYILLLVGLIWKIIDLIKNKKKYSVSAMALYVCLFLCIIITVALSIYNSYFVDYQPQGRYCLPALPALAVFLTKGAEKLISKFKENTSYGIVGFTGACMICVSIGMFYLVYLPSV